MPAASNPFGLVPIWTPSGTIAASAYPSTSANDQLIPSGTNVAFYKYQPVKLVIGSGASVNGVTVAAGRIVLAPVDATGDAVLGSFAGVEIVDATGKPSWFNYWPASQTLKSGERMVVYVFDHPDNVYRIQLDGAPSTGAGYALTGKQFNLSNFANGSAQTGLSQATASATIVASAAQGQLRVLKPYTAIDNTSADTYPIYEVTIARHPFVAPQTSL